MRRTTRRAPPNVSATIASTTSAGISGLRPRPGRTRPTAATPSAANRTRHARTVSAFTPTARAIAPFATPSAAITNADA